METQLAAAFVIGLLGGVHCAGMCGGIVGAFTAQLPAKRNVLGMHAAYSLGRISSYAVAGALMGLIGGMGLFFNQILPVQILLYALANIALIFLGWHLAGLGNPLARLERLGAGVWSRIRPYGASLLPADTVPKAFLMGGVWGWLPCGLVYSVLATALVSGGAASGAAVMAAFGLGTLPSLMLAGMLFKRLRDFTTNPRVRFAAGALVAAFGVVGLARAAHLGEYIRQGLLCLT